MNPIARLRAWYSDPDQFIARAEVAWFRGWMRGRGGAWVALLFMLQILHRVAFYIITPKTGPPPVGVTYAVGIIYFMLPLVIVAWLIDRRSLAPFRPGCIENLRLTPVRPDQLWPGLATAPILFMVLWGVLRVVLFEILMDQLLPPGNAANPLTMTFGFGFLGAPDSIANLALFFAFCQCLSLLMIVTGALAFVLLPIRMQIPRGGWAGSLLWMGLIWILVEHFLARIFIRILVALPNFNFKSHSFGIWFNVMNALAFSLIAAWGLRWLRSEAGFGKALGKE